MYAVIESGGKQYVVKEGDQIKVELLTDYEPGQTFDCSQVLVFSNGVNVEFGQPYVNQAKVIFEVVDHGRHAKVKILKFRRRKHHMKRQGHRQYYTKLKVAQIVKD